MTCECSRRVMIIYHKVITRCEHESEYRKKTERSSASQFTPEGRGGKVFGKGPEKLKSPLAVQADDSSLDRMINSAGRFNQTLLQRIIQSVVHEDIW